MTDREKLIELLQHSPTDVMGNRGVGAMADHLISNGVTFQRWIPVSERLPDESGTYIVFTVSGCVTTAIWYPERDFRNYKGEFIGHEPGRFHRNATHWMPLPEGP